MANFDYSVTFPCYNSVEYTKKLVESMKLAGDDFSKVIAVDNNSHDKTLEYLKKSGIGKVIANKKNLGFGTALTQGILEMQSEWTIVMNNDLIVSENWIDKLIQSAIDNDLKVICPALLEGDYDYDLRIKSNQFSSLMDGYVRMGDSHAVCIAIHESVWHEVGYFRPTPALFGYEDALFFNELKKFNYGIGVTSAAFLHHFGSITQNAMRLEMGLSPSDDLSPNKNDKLLCQSWLKRKSDKIKKKKLRKKSAIKEKKLYEITVRGYRSNNKFLWW